MSRLSNTAEQYDIRPCFHYQTTFLTWAMAEIQAGVAPPQRLSATDQTSPNFRSTPAGSVWAECRESSCRCRCRPHEVSPPSLHSLRPVRTSWGRSGLQRLLDQPQPREPHVYPQLLSPPQLNFGNFFQRGKSSIWSLDQLLLCKILKPIVNRIFPKIRPKKES